MGGDNGKVPYKLLYTIDHASRYRIVVKPQFMLFKILFVTV